MPDVVVTEVRAKGPPRRSRNLEEHLMVRFPALYRSVALAVSRFGLGTRLRRALLRRALVSGWAAFNRRDLELMLVRYASEVEFQFYAGFQTLGLDGTYRGREQIRASLQELTEDWEAIELEPAYVVDLTDTVLNLGFMRARGRASGARVEMEMAQLLTVRDGLVASDRSWNTWDEGLRAAGLNPDAMSLPRGHD